MVQGKSFRRQLPRVLAHQFAFIGENLSRPTEVSAKGHSA